MCKYRPVSLIVIIFALRVDGGAIPSGPASKLASSQGIPGESHLKDVSEDQQPLPEPAQKAAGDASNPGIPALSAGLSAMPEAAVGRNGNAATNTRIQDTVNRPVPEIGKNVKMSHSNALAVQVDNSARNREQLHKNAAVKDAFRNQNVQHSAASPAKTQTSVGIVEQGHISSSSVGRPAEAPLQNQQSSSWKKQMPKQIDRSDGRALETPSELHSPIHSAMGASSGTKDQSVRADVKAIVNRTRASNASVSQNGTAASSTPARPVVTEVSTTASTKATTVPQIYDADGDKKAEKVPEIPVPEPIPADESGEIKSGPAVKKQEDGDSAGESDRRTVPTQWPPQYSSGESRPWAQKPPETAPVGPYPTTGEEDSHFFAYFLAATVVCIVAYLAFHNKRKIMALVIEGRAGRQRRQTVAYRRLDTAEKDDVKGRAIF